MKIKKSIVFIGILSISILSSCNSKKEKSLIKSDISYIVSRESSFHSVDLNSNQNIKSKSTVKGTAKAPIFLKKEQAEIQDLRWNDSTVISGTSKNPNREILTIVANNTLSIEDINIDKMSDSQTRFIIKSKSKSSILKFNNRNNVNKEIDIRGIHTDTIILPMKDDEEGLLMAKFVFLNQSIKPIKNEIIKLSKE